MTTHTRTLAALTLATAVAVTAAGCAAATNSAASPKPIQHVHDVAFDPDGAVLVGAHTGAYRVDLTTDEVSLLGSSSSRLPRRRSVSRSIRSPKRSSPTPTPAASPAAAPPRSATSPGSARSPPSTVTVS